MAKNNHAKNRNTTAPEVIAMRIMNACANNLDNFGWFIIRIYNCNTRRAREYTILNLDDAVHVVRIIKARVARGENLFSVSKYCLGWAIYTCTDGLWDKSRWWRDTPGYQGKVPDSDIFRYHGESYRIPIQWPDFE